MYHPIIKINGCLLVSDEQRGAARHTGRSHLVQFQQVLCTTVPSSAPASKPKNPLGLFSALIPTADAGMSNALPKPGCRVTQRSGFCKLDFFSRAGNGPRPDCAIRKGTQPQGPWSHIWPHLSILPSLMKSWTVIGTDGTLRALDFVDHNTSQPSDSAKQSAEHNLSAVPLSLSSSRLEPLANPPCGFVGPTGALIFDTPDSLLFYGTCPWHASITGNKPCRHTIPNFANIHPRKIILIDPPLATGFKPVVFLLTATNELLLITGPDQPPSTLLSNALDVDLIPTPGNPQLLVSTNNSLHFLNPLGQTTRTIPTTAPFHVISCSASTALLLDSSGSTHALNLLTFPSPPFDPYRAIWTNPESSIPSDEGPVKVDICKGPVESGKLGALHACLLDGSGKLVVTGCVNPRLDDKRKKWDEGELGDKKVKMVASGRLDAVAVLDEGQQDGLIALATGQIVTLPWKESRVVWIGGHASSPLFLALVEHSGS